MQNMAQGYLSLNKLTPSQTATPEKSAISTATFIWLCAGAYLLSTGYGVTFLIPLLVEPFGADEHDAGLIISMATISTVVLVIASGHIADMFGIARSVALSGATVALSALGFALAPSAGWPMLLSGLILGVGWGVFYTLGPILVAAVISPRRRSHFFALFSGSMMAGIGTGPIVGRLLTGIGLPLESAFIFAALSCLAGAAIYTALDGILRRSGGAIKGNKLGFAAAMSILRSKAAFPIVMVGLGGAVFGGLSSFQISYAAERQLDYSLFFSGFVAAVIVGRLFLSGAALRCEPHITSLVLTCCVVAAIVLLMMIETHPIAYVAAAALLGGGYGLTYSVINGLVANEAPSGLVPQALLLFSLSYFVGVFGFPLIAGALIAEQGIRPMMIVTLVIASINATIPLVRVFSR